MLLEWTPENNLEIPHEAWKSNYEFNIRPYVMVKSVRFKSGAKNFDYVPWDAALRLMWEYDPKLDVGFDYYDGKPYCKTETGVFLSCYIFDRTTGKRTPSLYYAVLNMAMESEANPPMHLIINNQKRAACKAIAVYTGIGFSIYSDESLQQIPPVPPTEEGKPVSVKQPDNWGNAPTESASQQQKQKRTWGNWDE